MQNKNHQKRPQARDKKNKKDKRKKSVQLTTRNQRPMSQYLKSSRKGVLKDHTSSHPQGHVLGYPDISNTITVPTGSRLEPGQNPAAMQRHRNHDQHAHNRFAEDLRRSIDNFTESQENYAQALQFPEVALARIPFICPVPTAVCRGTAVYTFTPDVPTTVGAPAQDTWGFSFIPEALLGIGAGGGDINQHAPFYYGTDTSTKDVITMSNHMLVADLLPNIRFESMSSCRVVGASCIVTMTQRLVDRAGYGLCSRVYGLASEPIDPNSHERKPDYDVSKTTVMNSIYKDECNFSDPSNKSELRMQYAPADFSDLHMRVMLGGSQGKQPDMETQPVIQGFITGFGSAIPAITIEFNVTFEYVPKPELYQMTHRKPAQINSKALNVAENLIAKINAHVANPQTLQEAKGQIEMGSKGIHTMLSRAPRSTAGHVMNFMNNFANGVTSFQPSQTAAGAVGGNVMSMIASAAPKVLPFLVNNPKAYDKDEDQDKDELERRIKTLQDPTPQSFQQQAQNHSGGKLSVRDRGY